MTNKEINQFDFVVKKTNELSNEEIYKINNLFNITFKPFLIKERTSEEFKKKFLNNFLKFSFHGLMKLNNEIIGCYHVIPYEFNYFSQRKLFGQSVDTTINSKYRGNIYNLKRLASLVYDELKKHQIIFVYGLPNEKFYLVKKKVLGWKDIGKLNYYIYPINLIKFLKNLNILNFFLLIFIKIFLKLKISLKKDQSFAISKIYNDDFHYSRYNEEHKIVSKKNYKLIYKFVNSKKYNQAKIAYIIDVLPLSKKNLEQAVGDLIEMKEGIDLIVYIGRLKAIPKNLLKIPNFLLKKQTMFSGKIIEKNNLQDQVFDCVNWNINSSNFDIK